MLIGVDGFEASVTQRVGVGRLAIELIKGLNRVDRDNRYRVYVPQKRQIGELQLQSKRWLYRMVRHTRLWSQVTLPLHLYLDKPRPDVFLSPVHYAPRFCPCPAVIFVFDLAYIHFPELFNRADLYKLKHWTKYSVEKAAKVLTISEASKADIIEQYQIDSSKVEVIYPGVNLMVQGSRLKAQGNMKKVKDIPKKYGIGKNYILYVGTLQPRKNLVRLIEAYKLLITNYKLPITNELQLVIVGKKGWMYGEIFKRVKELSLEKDVVFTGFVEEDELTAFYQGAKCLSLVSLYEGFGLPVVEAMAYGVPVVVSNTSSLPEVVGNAGIMVNPEDTQDIADGILKVLGMSEFEYKQLSDNCKKQASKFSWEETARETLKALEEVVLS